MTGRYDPLLAKIIAHGPDRAESLGLLGAALGQTRILGVRSNLRFLRWLVAQSALVAGEMRIDTLETLALPPSVEPPDAAWAAAALALSDSESDVWGGGWRANAPASVVVAHEEEERAAAPAAGWPVVRHDDLAYADVEGQSVEFRLAPPPAVEEAVRHATHGEDHAILTAPMPGRVIAVRHRPGDAVAAHDPVVVIEAMKMEHAVAAPLAGTVTAVHVGSGDQVQRGDVLAEVSA